MQSELIVLLIVLYIPFIVYVVYSEWRYYTLDKKYILCITTIKGILDAMKQLTDELIIWSDNNKSENSNNSDKNVS